VADRFAVSSRPGDIERDAVRRRLYVSLSEESALARIDLNDGSTAVIPLAGPELLSVRQGLSPVRMQRYAFDPIASPVLLQTNPRVGGNARDLAISPDGEHVALADGAGNIADYVATDLASYRGEWKTGAYPRAVAFDSASGRLLASNSSAPILFDVGSFARQTCGSGVQFTRYHWFVTDRP